MAEMPPSLGQETKKELKLVGQEYPLPKTRQELVAAFGDILSQGGVQKVVVEIGKPIKVSRYMPDMFDAQPEIPAELVSDDLYSNARNAPMEGFDPGEVSNWYEGLFSAFVYLEHKKLRPKAFMIKNFDFLRKGLKLEKTAAMTALFGIDVVVSEEIPPDVLLFVAVRPGEEIVALSLRILMSTR